MECEAGRWIYDSSGQPFAYCADIHNNKGILLRITHPDISTADIEKLGGHLKRMRMLRNQKIIDRRGGGLA